MNKFDKNNAEIGERIKEVRLKRGMTQEMLSEKADKKTMPSYYGEFLKNLNSITAEYAQSLCDDISKYCTMYDYRNSGGNTDWGSSKDSVERTVKFLSGVTDIN